MAILVGIAALPWFRFVDNPSTTTKRHVPLDGLRGFLAFSVFVFHLIDTHDHLESCEWEPPRSVLCSAGAGRGIVIFHAAPTGFSYYWLAPRGIALVNRFIQRRRLRMSTPGHKTEERKEYAR